MTRTDQRLKKIHSVLRHRQPDLTIVMENIHDPHNVSAMLRSADAVGVMEVQLVYTKEEFPKIGEKSSASARKWVLRRKFTSIDECYTKLHSEGFRIYATHLGEEAVSLYSLGLTRPAALVFGNEHRGVSDEAAEKADGNFLIPMMGMIQSLNVSVACAVSLYEAFRQRMEAGQYKSRKFSKNVFDALFEEWLKK
ncbi:MAG: RNA methyltransferase [Bacteroidota bacterium]